eukprot:SAG22_NODE_1958_length_3252_cov_2.013003_2_plen_218_part_00
MVKKKDHMKWMVEQARLAKLAESKRTVDLFLNTASSGLMTEHEKRKRGLAPGISSIAFQDVDQLKADEQAEELAEAMEVKAAARAAEVDKKEREKRREEALARKALAPVRASDRAVGNLAALKASQTLRSAGSKAVLFARLGMMASDKSRVSERQRRAASACLPGPLRSHHRSPDSVVPQLSLTAQWPVLHNRPTLGWLAILAAATRTSTIGLLYQY